jgi:adenylosuccinate synthase
MKLDVLDGMDSVKICTGYRHHGQRLDGMPDTTTLFEVEPVYEALPGWRLPARIERLDDLPATARLFLDRLAALVDVPVTMIGLGRGREALIRVQPLAASEVHQ